MLDGGSGGIAVMTIGPVGHDVAQLAEELASEGIYIAHYDMMWLKPLDTKAI